MPSSSEKGSSNYQLRAVEPPASEIEAEIMEQLAQRPHDRLCVEALALIQRLRMRAPSAADHYDCAACDQPGEHCGADK